MSVKRKYVQKDIETFLVERDTSYQFAVICLLTQNISFLNGKVCVIIFSNLFWTTDIKYGRVGITPSHNRDVARNFC